MENTIYLITNKTTGECKEATFTSTDTTTKYSEGINIVGFTTTDGEVITFEKPGNNSGIEEATNPDYTIALK